MKENIKDRLSAAIVFLVLIFALYTVIIQMMQKIKRMNMTDKQIFTDIYKEGTWGGWNGVGPGSTTEDGANPFLHYLQDFLDSHADINSIVDIGCGYGELLKEIRFPKGATYLGLDLVESVINYNKKHYVRDSFSFKTVDSVKDLAIYKGDLLILKDVIQHWSIEKILFAKKHIIPNFKYAIVVNNIYTAYATKINSDIQTGDSRPLDLTAAPFFMKPAHVEDYTLPPYRIKRIHLFVNEK